MFTLIPANAVFGLLAALFWGGGDFSGGMAVKRAGGSVLGALRIILISHSASLCILLIVALMRGDSFPHGAPLFWGISTGIIGGLSATGFYIALARGAMGAAAAISGLLAAAIPSLVTIVAEGSPGALHLLGFVIAGIAIWMVAAAPTGVLEDPTLKPDTSTTLLAVISGAGFGAYFVALKMAGVAGVAWPLATARMGSITTCTLCVFILTMMNRRAIRGGVPGGGPAVVISRSTLLWALSTAVLDTSGNLFFVSATRAGRLDLAAVLASLYPATTILLAGLILKEHFSKRQGIGMAIAAVAVVMITL